ncbi:aminoacyl-tRNA deacylase [Motiliproteus sp.]|uniref:aminoacyl-tRNA deacylase n=1 Tax=Motiliproteus sp. TaxID=1898955 RepID=UPI003BA84457
MAMPIPMSEFLSNHHVDYHILKHKPTAIAAEAAQAAAIPLAELARSSIVESINYPGQLLMVLLPASHLLDLNKLGQLTDENFREIEPAQLKEIFQDATPCGIPGLGQPFNLDMVVDQRLFRVPRVYLEDGDNTELVKLSQQQFAQLLGGLLSGDISRPPPSPTRTAMRWSTQLT